MNKEEQKDYKKIRILGYMRINKQIKCKQAGKECEENKQI